MPKPSHFSLSRLSIQSPSQVQWEQRNIESQFSMSYVQCSLHYLCQWCHCILATEFEKPELERAPFWHQQKVPRFFCKKRGHSKLQIHCFTYTENEGKLFYTAKISILSRSSKLAFMCCLALS